MTTSMTGKQKFVLLTIPLTAISMCFCFIVAWLLVTATLRDIGILPTLTPQPESTQITDSPITELSATPDYSPSPSPASVDTNSPVQTLTKVTDNGLMSTSLPDTIVEKDEAERDGIIFIAGAIRRLYKDNDTTHQILELQISLVAANVPWTGYDVKPAEIILDDEAGNRYSAQSAYPYCKVYDNETCTTLVNFIIPNNATLVKVFYVSDRRLDDKEPVDVNAPEERRFIATLNLQNTTLELAPPHSYACTIADPCARINSHKNTHAIPEVCSIDWQYLERSKGVFWHRQ